MRYANTSILHTVSIISSSSISSCMQKMRLQIMMSADNIQALNTLCQKWHLRNLSVTVEELMIHFADLVRNYEKRLNEIKELTAERDLLMQQRADMAKCNTPRAKK